MRNNRIKTIITVLLIFGAVAGTAGAENYLYHRVYANAMVVNPEEAVEAALQWVDRIGGYYVYKATDGVVIRFPYDDVAALKSFLEKNTDKVIQFVPSAQDVRTEILQLESAIESREEILERNLEYLNQTDVTGTLAIESEVLEILRELENLKGRLKLLEQNRKYAYAEVRFSFQTQTLPEKIPTSFPWLGRLNFYSFISRGVK